MKRIIALLVAFAFSCTSNAQNRILKSAFDNIKLLMEAKFHSKIFKKYKGKNFGY
jgi:hypothetical protein